MHDDSSDIVDLSDSSWPPLEAPYDSIPNERIKLSLRRPTSTDEKYALFRRYQKHIHREAEDEISSRRGWEQFLVRAPFPDEGDGQDKAHAFFGVYHHEYRCMCHSTKHSVCTHSSDKGQLLAVGVLDILPHCVSSVYFFYEPAYADWELGKISAMVEICLTKELSRRISSLHWYYMGTCHMRGRANTRLLHSRVPKNEIQSHIQAQLCP